MSHNEYVSQALQHFSQEQLQEFYVDTAVDLTDQVPDSLENLLKFQSADWTFSNPTADCDVRPARNVEDLIDYVNTTLERTN